MTPRQAGKLEEEILITCSSSSEKVLESYFLTWEKEERRVWLLM